MTPPAGLSPATALPASRTRALPISSSGRTLRHVAWVLASLSLVLGSAGFTQEPASEAEEQAKRLVVMIRGKLAGTDTIGAGIIFGVGADRLYIATANHVVRQGTEEVQDQDLRVQFRWLPGESVPAKLLTDGDHALDLAVLSVTNLRAIGLPRLPFDRLGDVSALKRRDAVYSVGYPTGKPWHSRVTPDAVSETSADLLKFESTFLAPGHSGGALVNDRWELVGMIRSDQPPDGEAVRIDRILEKLRQWNYPVSLSRRAAAEAPSGRGAEPSAPPVTSGQRPERRPPAAGFVSVTPGVATTCGVMASGAAYCWGDNRNGQLGNGSPSSSSVPVPVAGDLLFRLVTSLGPHACGLTRSDAAYCWGFNRQGQIGNGTKMDAVSAPAPVSGGLAFVSLSAGYLHTCGVTRGQAVYCWGSNRSGELGNGSKAESAVPVAVAADRALRLVSAGGGHTCGLSTEGVAYCWGGNRSGELGTGSQADSAVPVPVAGRLRFRLISAGLGYTCGLTAEGVAYCWGENSAGQLGNGSQVDSPTPVPVEDPARRFPSPTRVRGFRALSLGYSHTCGITAENIAYCWGANGAGQLGNGSKTNSPIPVPVSGNLVFRSIDIGGKTPYTCGVTTDGTAHCWGDNSAGQLGNGSTTSSAVPVPVSSPPP